MIAYQVMIYVGRARWFVRIDTNGGAWVSSGR